MSSGHSSTYRYPVMGKSREYSCSPLTDAAHDALTAWVRQRFHEEHAALVDSLRTHDQQEAAIRELIKTSSALTWHDSVGMKYISTVDGILRLLYEGCRVSEPTLEFVAFKADILAACANEAAAVRVSRTAFEECNPKVPAQKAELTTSPASKQRKRKST